MPTIKIDTQADYDNLMVLPGVVLMDFWAPWCGPCRLMGKVLDQLSREGATIAKLNTDEHPQVMDAYRVEALPTILGLRQGAVIQRWVGVTKREYLEAFLSEWDRPTFDPRLFAAVYS